MSRIGRAPVKVPAGVEIKVDANVFTVKGPLGTLSQDYDGSVIEIKVEMAKQLFLVKTKKTLLRQNTAYTEHYLTTWLLALLTVTQKPLSLTA